MQEYDAYGEAECIKSRSEVLKARCDLGDQSIIWMIILKWILY
jgi:hypothetical protein